MFKKIINKLNNRGSSFIVMIVSMSFLAILAASILTAVGYTYKLKFYNLNSKNNFYYVEQAMDEVYAGVGNVAVQYLQKAYQETIEVLVYYDPDLRAYVTRKDEDANAIMKKTFLKYMEECEEFSNAVPTGMMNTSFLKETIKACITNPSITVDLSQTQRAVVNGNVVIQNVTLKRTASYKVGGGGSEQYVQSITTDIVLGEPGYDVSFANTNDSFSSLYDYSLIADSGIEFKNPASTVNVSGDVYGGNDFYNKSYNTYSGAATDVSSYQTGEAAYTNQDGLQETSMYSGVYINGAKVTLQSNNIVVPGTVGVFNSGSLVVSAKQDGSVVPSNLWADSIVLGGYTSTLGGASANINANTYVYDDLEVNADMSNLKIQGKYYGYNYSQDPENRNFIDAAKSNYPDDSLHYNSSAIILNGQETSLDFEYLDALYIAGQSYVELSKVTTKAETEITSGSDKETVTTKTYTYDDSIEDYLTGESLSIKSNQVAYQALKTWQVDEVKKGDGTNEYFVSINELVRDAYDYRADPKQPNKRIFDDLDKVPVIKQVISGNAYYFLKFETTKYKHINEDGTETVEDYLASDKRQDFMVGYSLYFATEPNGEYSNPGAKYLKDITDYDRFEVDSIVLPNDPENKKIFSNGLITVKDATTFSITAGPESTAVFEDMLSTQPTQTSWQFMDATKELKLSYNLMKYFLTTEVSSDYRVYMQNVMDGNIASVESAGTAEAAAFAEDMKIMMGGTSDVSKLSLTPFVKYFDVAQIQGDGTCLELPSGYLIWIAKGDVEITDPDGDGNIQGIVIAKGDVTFDEGVDSFQGLIASGSKIIVEHTMSFIANAEICKSALRECFNSSDAGVKSVVDCFKGYGESQTGTATPPPVTPDPDASTEEYVESDKVEVTEKDITEVVIDDVISYENWKKNVE